MAKKNQTNQLVKNFVDSIDVSSLQEFNVLMNEIKKTFIEKVLNEELDEHLGYSKWDQNSRQVSNNYRNGTYNKTVTSTTGEIDLKIPRDTNSTFEPQIVPKYTRDISGMDEKIISLYAKGVSTREIAEQIKEFYSVDVSKDFISRVTDKILPEIMAWRSRKLLRYYPIVFIDGIRFDVKEDGVFCQKTVYIVMGINEDGKRDILGFWVGESESAKYWTTVLSDLKSRGVEKINILACDNLAGISQAINYVFPKTQVQKCIIHQIRNSMKYVYHKDAKEFANDMKLIYKAPNLELATQALEFFEKKWGQKYKSAVQSWKDNFAELTTFLNYPADLRRVIYTTNPIENLNRNIRKLTKTKGGITSLNALNKLVYLAIQKHIKSWNNKVPNWCFVLQYLKDNFE